MALYLFTPLARTSKSRRGRATGAAFASRCFPPPAFLLVENLLEVTIVGAMEMAIGNLLTTEEVAEELGVTPGRVRQFVTDERLKIAQRVGHILLFERELIEKFRDIPRPAGRRKKTEN